MHHIHTYLAKFQSMLKWCFYFAKEVYGSTCKWRISCSQTLQNSWGSLDPYGFLPAWTSHCCLQLYFFFIFTGWQNRFKFNVLTTIDHRSVIIMTYVKHSLSFTVTTVVNYSINMLESACFLSFSTNMLSLF